MDFALTEEQEMLRKSARDFLAEKCPKTLVTKMEQDETGYPSELWQEMTSLGWLGLVFPQAYGGAGMSFFDLAVLLEEMGRACLPGPFFSTVVLGGLPVLDAGTEEQKKAFLPQIASGGPILTFALTEADGKYGAASVSTRASPDGNYFLISGSKFFVPDAHIASYMLVAARTSDSAKLEDGITLFIVDARSPGISGTALKTIAGDKLYKVDFDRVRVAEDGILGGLGRGWSQVEKIIQRAAVARCCEVAGAAQQVLEMTIDYAKTRVQFGHPIGSFQAIQHHCANMAIDVDGVRFVTYKAAWMLSQEMPCTKEVAMAKAWTADAYRRIIALSHAVHGAIGFTMERDLQFYTRRAKAAEVSFGDATFHREIIAQQIGL